MEEVQEEESVLERYSSMSKIEKMALLMIALGPDAASTLLKGSTQKMLKIFVRKLQISQL